jgi:SRSO17 transposase
MRDRLQQRVAAGHRGPRVIGVFDETGCPKKGDKTPGVERQ